MRTTTTTTTTFTLLATAATLASTCDAYAFVARPSFPTSTTRALTTTQRTSSTTTSLKMIDDVMLQGAGIAVAGLAAGIGLVAFTENQGERAKERGSGLSEGMSTRITGGLMEDVEVSSVADVSSLTAQLEQALKETTGDEKGVVSKQIELSEEEKKRIAEEADDGW